MPSVFCAYSSTIIRSVADTAELGKTISVSTNTGFVPSYPISVGSVSPIVARTVPALFANFKRANAYTSEVSVGTLKNSEKR
jgi:hypothetical protein